jgi:hypothetical protein
VEFAENFGVKSGHFGSADQTPFTTNLYSCVPLGRQRAEVFLQEAVPENDPIPRAGIAMLSTGRHSGFHVFCGNHISPDDETAMENLARYIIRVSFSQERMQYLEQKGKVVYTSKDSRTSKSFPALEWPANLCSYIPNRGKPAVRYCGFRNTVRHYSSTGNHHFNSDLKVEDK